MGWIFPKCPLRLSPDLYRIGVHCSFQRSQHVLSKDQTLNPIRIPSMIEGLFLNSRGVIGLPGFPASPEGLRGGLFRHSDHRQPRTNGLLSLENWRRAKPAPDFTRDMQKKNVETKVFTTFFSAYNLSRWRMNIFRFQHAVNAAATVRSRARRTLNPKP